MTPLILKFFILATIPLLLTAKNGSKSQPSACFCKVWSFQFGFPQIFYYHFSGVQFKLILTVIKVQDLLNIISDQFLILKNI